MTLTINDKSDVTKLEISNGSKILLRKKGKNIKELLKFVYNGTKNENVKKTIEELKPMYKLMLGSNTKIDIKD